MDFHPQSGAVDLSDLFLTCGVDWTVKLWRAGVGGGGGGKGENTGPVMSFEESDDYVYDVRWHPHHPALFGSVDGAGKFDLWDLNVDTEVRSPFLPRLFLFLGHGIDEGGIGSRCIDFGRSECAEGVEQACVG